MAYTKTVWVNDSAPAIDQTNLGNIEDGVYKAHGEQGTFTSGDLVANILTITHSLGEQFVHVSIWDDSNFQVTPEVECIDTAGTYTAEVDFTDITVSNTWKYRVSL